LECEFHVMLCMEMLSTLSLWKDDIVERRVLGSVLWRVQNIWHGYSKRLHVRVETMKVCHDSGNRHLWTNMV
jgi:hypothetical protein